MCLSFSLTTMICRLLEELADEDGLALVVLAGEDGLEILLGGVSVSIKELEVVLLSIGDVVENGRNTLATEDPDTIELVVGAAASTDDAAESVLADRLAASDETTQEVDSRALALDILGVLVDALSDAVALVVEVGPEGLEVLVVQGLLEEETTLDVLKAHGRLGELIKLVLGLSLLSSSALSLHLLEVILDLGSLGSLDGVDLSLARSHSLSSSELHLTEDRLSLGLVNNGLPPSDNVGDLRDEVSIEEVGEGEDQSSCESDIGSGDVVANEVGVDKEVGVNSLESLEEVSLGLDVLLLVEGEDLGEDDGENPSSAGALNAGVDEVEPLVNNGAVVVVGTEEVGVNTETSDVLEDSIRLEDRALRSGHNGHLASGVHGKELRSLVVNAHLNGLNIDLDAVVGSGDEGLENTVVVGVSVDGKRHLSIGWMVGFVNDPDEL